ncbi:hypothetical protein SBVc24_0056 [Vibrio phage 24]|nr:hypothetical protein SBVc24_0056 [Vibrio phage 24]
MNTKQFNMVADRVIRKDCIRKGVYDVIFNGLSSYEAERKYHCVPNTVKRSLTAVQRYFDNCVAIASAE